MSAFSQHFLLIMKLTEVMNWNWEKYLYDNIAVQTVHLGNVIRNNMSSDPFPWSPILTSFDGLIGPLFVDQLSIGSLNWASFGICFFFAIFYYCRFNLLIMLYLNLILPFSYATPISQWLIVTTCNGRRDYCLTVKLMFLVFVAVRLIKRLIPAHAERVRWVQFCWKMIICHI